MKNFFSLINIFLAYGGYIILSDAAKAILRGNVSKSKYKKIIYNTSILEKIKLNYIKEYAVLYRKSLGKIILFSRFYLINFVFQILLSVSLMISKIGIEYIVLLIIFNFLVDFPVIIFLFLKTSMGWKKGDGKEWVYEKHKKTIKK